jgi:hypothetical protein
VVREVAAYPARTERTFVADNNSLPERVRCLLLVEKTKPAKLERPCLSERPLHERDLFNILLNFLLNGKVLPGESRLEIII